MNPFLATDAYKVAHHKMYPKGTTLVYSNFTPRSNKHAPKGCNKVVSFGQQMVMMQIKEMFDADFFMNSIRRIMPTDKSNALEALRSVKCNEIKKEYSLLLGTDFDVSHIEALWDLGYLPIKVKSLPEGTLVPMGVPVLTIVNTQPEFFWLTNFLETLISNLLWKPMTSATIAHQYKKNLTKRCLDTDKEAIEFVNFQGHDFSMRGMDSIDAVISSGLGHATSFLGSDSLPVIHGARKYYGETDFVIGSVSATEHSVMCAGGAEIGDELETFRYLMEQFPTGILSIVSDTWDLWKVLTEYLPVLKEEILQRDGKIVIRPDSGDPVDIICGNKMIIDLSKNKHCVDLAYCERYCQDVIQEDIQEETPHGECGVDQSSMLFRFEDKIYEATGFPEWNRHDKQYYYIDGMSVKVEEVELSVENKGVIELLWDIFGGTVNSQGYKVLDPHIGAIYGDSITIDRAEEICERLESKGFASTNIVLGIGSFTYQYNTRDTFGFAMKATYCEITHPAKTEGETGFIEPREIFKDPITDDGTKKSAKGLLYVQRNESNGDYELVDQVSWSDENSSLLHTIFNDGVPENLVTLSQIRAKLNQ